MSSPPNQEVERDAAGNRLTAHSHEECRVLLKSLSDYVDCALDESLCEKIERHMAGCERCQIVVDTLRKTVELYHAEAERMHAEGASSVPDEVRARLFLRLKLEDLLNEQKDAV